MKYILLIIFTTTLLYSCEREISIDLPQHEPRLVVEGFIEQNQPPVIILTRSSGYFEGSIPFSGE